MDFVFKVVPQSVAILFVLSPEFTQFIVNVVATAKIEAWDDPELLHRKKPILQFCLATSDIEAALVAWLLTTAIIVSIAISGESRFWVGVFGVGAVVSLFVGMSVLFRILRRLDLNSYSVNSDEDTPSAPGSGAEDTSSAPREPWPFPIPKYGTAKEIFVFRVVVALVNVALIAAALLVT